MLYAVLLSVACTTLVAGVVRLVAQSANDQARRERALRARAFANIQVAVYQSQGIVGSLTLPATIIRTGATGIAATGTAVAVPGVDGLVRIEQTITYKGTSYFFRDFVGNLYASTQINWATRGDSSDFTIGGSSSAQDGTGVPDWAAVNLSGTPVGFNAVAFAGFSNSVTMQSSSISLLASSLGMTVAQLQTNEFIAFSVSNSASSSFANATFEFWRGNNKLVVAGNSVGTTRATITASNYQTMFGLGASPLGANTYVQVIVFDFDAITGGATFKTYSNQQRVVIASSSGTAAPRVDAMGRLDQAESAPVQGLLVEVGKGTGRNEYNSIVDVPVRFVGSAPSSNRNAQAISQEPNVFSGGANPSGWSTFGHYCSWSGTIVPPTTGNYQFRFTTDDGSRLWVNDKLAASSWAGQGATTYTSANIPLTANSSVSLWYEWWDWGGGEAYSLEWLPPGGSWTVIPDSQLRPGLGSENVAYFGFDDNISTGWSWQNTDIRKNANGTGPDGQTVPNSNGIGVYSGSYLGDFGGQNAETTLTLSGVSSGRIVLTCELIIFGSWELSGNGGPDYLNVTANGTQVASILGGDTATVDSGNSLPFVNVMSSGVTRLVRIEFQHSGGNLALKFKKSSPSNSNINNESFGLDNVMVRRKR